jgi:hypothetical protein
MRAQSRYFAPISALSAAIIVLLVAVNATAALAMQRQLGKIQPINPDKSQPGKVEAARPDRTTAGKVEPISPALCEDMKIRKVLTSEAPVGCGRLSLVTFPYFGFDGRVHADGEIVVMDAAAPHVLGIFAKLQEMRFAIAKAKLMDQYDGNDDTSMADDNTSAFNARKIAGSSSISLHAYGLAIDINPIQNPSIKRSGANLRFDPVAGNEYANRFNDRPWKKPRPGMAEAVIDVFADGGFLIWGGYWSDPIDYQHFQTGRSLAQELARLAPAQAASVFDALVERYRACRAGQAHASRTACVANSTPGGRPDF